MEEVKSAQRTRSGSAPRPLKKAKFAVAASTTAIHDVLLSTMKQNNSGDSQPRRRMTLNSLEAEYAEHFIFSMLPEQAKDKHDLVHEMDEDSMPHLRRSRNVSANAEPRKGALPVKSTPSGGIPGSKDIPRRTANRPQLLANSTVKNPSFGDMRRRLNAMQKFIDLHRSMIDGLSLDKSDSLGKSDNSDLQHILARENPNENSNTLNVRQPPSVSDVADSLLIKIEILRRQLGHFNRRSEVAN
jgi:hypothetical protein